MREQHAEQMIGTPLLQQVRHRPVETHRDARRVGRARSVGEREWHERGESREGEPHQPRPRQAPGAGPRAWLVGLTPAGLAALVPLARAYGPRPANPAGAAGRFNWAATHLSRGRGPGPP